MANSARHGFVIAPHDVNLLPKKTMSIYVGTTGNLKVRLVGDTADVTLNSIPAGTILNIQAIRVYTTGTTASNLVGLY